MSTGAPMFLHGLRLLSWDLRVLVRLMWAKVFPSGRIWYYVVFLWDFVSLSSLRVFLYCLFSMWDLRVLVDFKRSSCSWVFLNVRKDQERPH